MVFPSVAHKLSMLVAGLSILCITENDVGTSVGGIFFVRITGNNLCTLVDCMCIGQNAENKLGTLSVVLLFDA